MTARRTRARLAVIACLLWLAGVEAMPAMHEAMHDRLAPHTHVDGAMVVVHYAAKRAPRGTGETGVRDPRGHAAGLAHHDAAIAPPPPPRLFPMPVDRRPQVLPIAEAIAWGTLDPLAPQARGPPSLA